MKIGTNLVKSYAKLKKCSDKFIFLLDDALVEESQYLYTQYLHKKAINCYPDFFVNRDITKIWPKIHKNLLRF